MMLLKVFTLLLGILLSMPLLAAQEMATELNGLKQQMNQLRTTVLEQDSKINAQQRELQLLRGDNEILTHRLEQLKQQQQSHFSALEQRLNAFQQGHHSTAKVSPTTVVANAPPEVVPTAPIIDPVAEKQAYDAAFKQLQIRQYQAAITGFEQVMLQYPQGEYSDNAQYWLAEAYYALKDYTRALGEFNRLLQQYPNSDKRSHAELKIGYVYFELQDYVAARVMLEQVKLNYPTTAVARLAEQKLARLPARF